ncbi:MCP four helix bundle domain-containing protein [Acidovorax sp. SUPP2522]|uniref:methyl-accepting chemotaxis protein n=1 Tax=unclassified Acidovorax TaxID=2684926 RepID=UPI00234AF2BC|nr:MULTISPECIES: methyl-accepting chemotaxis protein [unclassified Acidovorax]WCM98878.1 methyl-accepting chemotaxis protein [Acidovorax sp. GBBC 1281]GKT16626.1 MCP four helix bundle domain-containing protein [Acidovorax sp. SUPP2522]
MQHLKISTRLIIGFGLLATLGVAIALLAALRMQGLAQDLTEVSANRMVKVAQFTDIKDNLNNGARAVRNIIISSDPTLRQGEKKKVAEARVANTALLQQLDASLALPMTREQLRIINANREPYNQAIDRAIALAEAGDSAAAGTLLIKEVRTLQNAVFGAVDASREIQRGLANQVAKEALAHANNMAVVLGVAAALMLIVSVLVGWLIVRDLSRSLGAEPSALAAAANNVAAGDLSAALVVRSGDTVSVMAAMARMQEALTSVVATVRHGSDGVATASAEIAQGNSDLSARTEQQASALEETAASMEELSSTVKQNADNARQANQLAVSASTVAAQGGQVVNDVVSTMKIIDDSSKRIADIIGVIDGIAFQTNILALNAAVEAARAGEQGRGFAVVASEVRNLAQRSAEAAKEIKSLIDSSVAQVGEGTALVAKAGSTMTEVVTAIRRVTDIIGEVSAASTEQSQGVAQVGEAIVQMDQVTQQNAALVEESAAAASSLSTQAQQLLQAVAIFKLGAQTEVSNAMAHQAGPSFSGQAGVGKRHAQPVANTRAIPRLSAMAGR